jgi:tetratricopeptide (TPR) repeat protein
MHLCIRFRVISLFLLLFLFLPGFSQDRKGLALSKAKEAQQFIDKGEADTAISLLQQSIKLDAGNMDYPYELAYAYMSKKEYSLALSHLQPLLLRKDVSDLIYELTGSCYEKMQQNDKAMQTYEEGLKKFPESGRLYQECGLYEMGQKEYNRALVYFEKGIETDPAFPSNYYWASRLYCHSTESVWGMMYGEIFMNLERGGQRSMEISKLLYETYKSQIKFRPDTTFTINFSKQATLDPKDTAGTRKMKLPFGVGAYEPTMALATLSEKSINLASVDRIRQHFLELYFTNGLEKTYPNFLFDFQEEVRKAGHLEAYNHWLLMEGDLTSFSEWHNTNSAKWLSFGNWFKDNELKPDKTHRFYRGQY